MYLVLILSINSITVMPMTVITVGELVNMQMLEMTSMVYALDLTLVKHYLQCR